jgi:hypothetical protein
MYKYIMTCRIAVTPWQTGEQEQTLIYGINGFSLNCFKTNGEWKISSTRIDKTKYASGKPVVNYKLVIRRRPQTIVINVVMFLC